MNAAKLKKCTGSDRAGSDRAIAMQVTSPQATGSCRCWHFLYVDKLPLRRGNVKCCGDVGHDRHPHTTNLRIWSFKLHGLAYVLQLLAPDASRHELRLLFVLYHCDLQWLL